MLYPPLAAPTDPPYGKLCGKSLPIEFSTNDGRRGSAKLARVVQYDEAAAGIRG